MDLLDIHHTAEELRDATAARVRDTVAHEATRRAVADRPHARVVQSMAACVADWRPPELPQLDQFDEVILDLETTGLRWWDQDRLIGAAIHTPDRRTRYLPIRHRIGPNLPEAQFFEWLRKEFRGKRIVNIRTKFDLHMLRADGIDLEAQGCTFGDVAHYAALLDDHRRLFNQEDLALSFLASQGILTAEECKVKTSHGYDLDPGRFADYPAGIVAPRAEGDVRTVALLQEAMWPQLTEQDLHRVRKVEDGIIPVVVEMEHNGAPIDIELLDRWVKQSHTDVDRALHTLFKHTGVLLETANKREDLARLFAALHLPVPLDAETQKESFADALLEPIAHPDIQLLRYAMALTSLRSKFLLPYQKSTARDGILRYELHQLPYQDDEKGKGGAVSGRFSSAAVSYYDDRGVQVREGANVQQVIGVKSQHNRKVKFNPTKAYIVKRLFIPDRKKNPEAVVFSSDMRQIEYRRFVHYSGAERLIASYAENPLTDYHVLVHGLILQHTGKDFERTHVKNLNFASLYGAGLVKIALMVGEISEAVYWELREAQQAHPTDRAQQRRAMQLVRADPRIARTRLLYETYHQMFPEVKELLALASKLAGERGWVKTILGRRARFRSGDRMYSALNRVIQGTAADDNKVAMIDAHHERHRLGLTPRLTVHDALVGDLDHAGRLPAMAEFLNARRLESRVPILWDSMCGPTWAEVK